MFTKNHSRTLGPVRRFYPYKVRECPTRNWRRNFPRNSLLCPQNFSMHFLPKSYVLHALPVSSSRILPTEQYLLHSADNGHLIKQFSLLSIHWLSPRFSCSAQPCGATSYVCLCRWVTLTKDASHPQTRTGGVILHFDIFSLFTSDIAGRKMKDCGLSFYQEFSEFNLICSASFMMRFHWSVSCTNTWTFLHRHNGRYLCGTVYFYSRFAGE